MMRTPLLLLSVLLASGCSSHWVKTRVDAHDFADTHVRCLQQAKQEFPVRNEVAQRTQYTTHYEKCSKTQDCDGKKYRAIERPQIDSYVMDVNSDSREYAFEQCMKAAGWQNETTWL